MTGGALGYTASQPAGNSRLAGIDLFAIARVTAGYLMGKPDQGGATLYQQLAKILGVTAGCSPAP